jgi:tellurite resistance-related uncharacterized protein
MAPPPPKFARSLNTPFVNFVGNSSTHSHSLQRKLASTKVVFGYRRGQKGYGRLLPFNQPCSRRSRRLKPTFQPARSGISIERPQYLVLQSLAMWSRQALPSMAFVPHLTNQMTCRRMIFCQGDLGGASNKVPHYEACFAHIVAIKSNVACHQPWVSSHGVWYPPQKMIPEAPAALIVVSWSMQ